MIEKISVIVPVYNAERYVGECIESVLCQDYGNVELLLVDDGSCDGSLDVCRGYECERVRVLARGHEGVSAARNAGVGAATGGLLAFVDADDRLPAGSLSVLAGAMASSGADFVCGGFCWDYDGRLVEHALRLAPGVYVPGDVLGRFIDDGTLSGFLLGSVCGGLYRRDVIVREGLRFNSGIRLNEDCVFNLEYLLRSERFAVVGDFVYVYRQHGGSASKKTVGLHVLNEDIKGYIMGLGGGTAERELGRTAERGLGGGRADRERLGGDVYDFEGQLKAREVSVALWEIINVPGEWGLLRGWRYIGECIGRAGVREGLGHLDWGGMPRYKWVYAVLMKWRMSLLLWLLIRFVQPLVMGRLRR